MILTELLRQEQYTMCMRIEMHHAAGSLASTARAARKPLIGAQQWLVIA